MKRIIPVIALGLVVCALCAAQIAENGFFVQEGIASWYGAEFEGRPTASGEIFRVSQATAAHPTLPFGTMLKVTNRNNNKSVIVRVNDRGPFVSARIIDLSKAAAEQLDMIRTGTAPVVIERVELALQVPPEAAVPAQPTVQVQAQPQVAVIPVQPQPQPLQSRDEQPAAPVYYLDVPPPAAAAQPATAQTWPAEDYPVTPEAPVITPRSEENFRPASPVEYPPSAAGWTAPTPVRPAVLKGVIPGENSTKLYRIQVGAFIQPRNAVETFEKLKNAGLNPAYEKYQNYYRVVLSGIRNTEVKAVAEKLGQAGFQEVLIKEEN
jgi:rare lipoprotein A